MFAVIFINPEAVLLAVVVAVIILCILISLIIKEWYRRL